MNSVARQVDLKKIAITDLLDKDGCEAFGKFFWNFPLLTPVSNSINVVRNKL